MRKRVVFAILIVGLSGNIAQVLLLREFLVTFYGNELSIGIILANWLILEALGSFVIGRMADRIERRIEAFIGLQLIFSLSFPLTIHLARIAKNLIGVIPGEAVGLVPILYISLLILAPVSISHGAQFTFGCKIYSSLTDEEAPSIGEVYIYETIGTAIGGLLFTYLLIPRFHSMEIAVGLAALNFLSGLLLVEHWSRRKLLAGSLASLLVLHAYLLAFGGCNWLHNRSIASQWRGHKVLHYENSIYGNITVTRRGEQYTFFSDGLPIVTVPVPDITFAEEFVHLALLAHPSPKDVFLISGGVGGVLNEILKHPVERVDYAELDPLIIKLTTEYATPLTEKELTSSRVHLKRIDGRLFARETPLKYDVVMVSFSSPSTLQLNRFYTEEFFRLVRRILKEDGILVITLPSSLTYLSEELKDLNLCIIRTLERVYPYVRIIPGYFNIYLASTSPRISTIDSATLIERLKARGIKTRLLTAPHIEYRLHKRWLNWFLASLGEGAGMRINSDLRPLGLFYDLALWNAQFSPYLRGVIKVMGEANLWTFLIPLAAFALFLLAGSVRVPKLRRVPIPVAIAFTGVAGMAFDLILSLAFQCLYGYVYYQIGLLVTAFMVGVAIGGWWMTRNLDLIRREKSCFIGIELALVLFSAALPAVLLLFKSIMWRPWVFSSLPEVFLLLNAAAGFLIGLEFPLASKMYLKGRGGVGGVAGVLYASDLLGGWLGALFISVALFPVLGVMETCALLVALKSLSLLLVAISYRG